MCDVGEQLDAFEFLAFGAAIHQISCWISGLWSVPRQFHLGGIDKFISQVGWGIAGALRLDVAFVGGP